MSKCLLYLVRKFPELAAEMIFQYSEHGARGRTVSFAATCVQVLKVVLKLLRLTSSSQYPSISLESYHDASFWRLMTCEHVVEEVFCCALSLLDFLKFHEVLKVEESEVYILELKRQLSWALAQGPQSITALWELGVVIRMEKKRRYQEIEMAHAEEEAQKEAEFSRDDAPLVHEDSGDLKVEEGVVYKFSNGHRTRLLTKSDIIKGAMASALEEILPEHHQGYDWLQIYSLKKDGASLQTVFNRCKGHNHTLVLVQDSMGVAFGGFATDQWKNKGENYFGSGESFLFTFKDSKLTKYEWTRANSYFMYSNYGGIAMGKHYLFHGYLSMLPHSYGQKKDAAHIFVQNYFYVS